MLAGRFLNTPAASVRPKREERAIAFSASPTQTATRPRASSLLAGIGSMQMEATPDARGESRRDRRVIAMSASLAQNVTSPRASGLLTGIGSMQANANSATASGCVSGLGGQRAKNCPNNGSDLRVLLAAARARALWPASVAAA